MPTIEKNICITINSLERGGAEKQSLLLAKALKPYHNVLLIILNPRPVYQERLDMLEREGLEHVFLTSNSFKKVIQLTKLFRRRKVQFVFSFLPRDTIIGAICGKMAGVDHIFGGIRNSYIPRLKFTILKWVHNCLLDYTIANNYSAYSSAISFGFNKKVFVVHNGIEIAPLNGVKSMIDDNGTINLISLGRLVRQKSYETAIQAISNLKQDLKGKVDLKYRIVGQGPEKDNIIKLIKEHGLEQEVELVLDPPDTYELLRTSDIYLCTSVFEGISNSIMEALNCSLPVVATDAGDNSQLVVHGKNGFVVPLHDIKKIAYFLKYLIESKENRIKMGEQGYNHLVANFSYEAYQKKYLEIIENTERIDIKDGNLVF